MIFLLLTLIVGMSAKGQDQQPFNLMIYGVGGGNLDDNIEDELREFLPDIDSESSNVNVFVQMKYSSPEGLKQQDLRLKNMFGERYVPGDTESV